MRTDLVFLGSTGDLLAITTHCRWGPVVRPGAFWVAACPDISAVKARRKLLPGPWRLRIEELPQPFAYGLKAKQYGKGPFPVLFAALYSFKPVDACGTPGGLQVPTEALREALSKAQGSPLEGWLAQAQGSGWYEVRRPTGKDRMFVRM